MIEKKTLTYSPITSQLASLPGKQFNNPQLYGESAPVGRDKRTRKIEQSLDVSSDNSVRMGLKCLLI
jgi:hypothetical protein